MYCLLFVCFHVGVVVVVVVVVVVFTLEGIWMVSNTYK